MMHLFTIKTSDGKVFKNRAGVLSSSINVGEKIELVKEKDSNSKIVLTFGKDVDFTNDASTLFNNEKLSIGSTGEMRNASKVLNAALMTVISARADIGGLLQTLAASASALDVMKNVDIYTWNLLSILKTLIKLKLVLMY
ncbi:MAG: hypothetical protein MTP17_01430 [Candidatus Midichloria sp.]|nr:MAG: hypothetical protein MTP17_01430 [Candidatus Midichloria sp.]